MHPLFSPWSFPSYAACLVLGFVSAWLLSRWLARKDGPEPRHIENVYLLAALVGVGGAIAFGKLFYEHRDLVSVLRFWESGPRVSYGGFIGAIAAAIGYSIACRLSPARMLDVAAPGIALGLAIGRVGCFLGGCCWGDVCVEPAKLADLPAYSRSSVQTVPWLAPAGFPLAVTFPKGSGPQLQHAELKLIQSANDRSLPVHPVQLYEAIAALLLSVWLCRAYRRPHRVGQIFLQLVFGYAAIRFMIEVLRADNPPDYFGLTIAQAVSMSLGSLALAMILWRRRKPHAVIPHRLLS